MFYFSKHSRFAVTLSLLCLTLPLYAKEESVLKKEAALAALARAEAALSPELKPQGELTTYQRETRAEAFFEAGRLCHDIMGDFAEALGEKADRYLCASLAYRENPLVRVYLGSSHIIQARDASSIIKKIAEVNIGLKEVDAAVKAAPDNILIRAIRVECTIGLPGIFMRLDTVSDDLEWLLTTYATKPSAYEDIYSPSRIFALKADELRQRGKTAMADAYQKRADELAKESK